MRKNFLGTAVGLVVAMSSGAGHADAAAAGSIASDTQHARNETAPATSGPQPESSGESSDAPGEKERAVPLAVVPPQAIEASVTYPPDGEGDAVVLLEFVVGVDGLVGDVQVLLGDEPFAAAAAAATSSWRFNPARRGGRAVASRIQFEVHFEMEVVAPKTEVEGSKTPDAAPPVVSSRANAAIDPGVEVVVQGDRPMMATRLRRAEARQVPGVLGDPVRAVEVMPGVSPIVSGLPLFYVRGAPPGNIGYFVDDVRVPFLYHAFLGPSVIHPELLESVALYPGPYPSDYGEFAGGIVTAELRNPRQRLGFGGELGLFDVGGYIETPFAGGKGGVFAAGRYSYSAWLARTLTTVRADFWNYQLLAHYKLSERDRISVFSLGAYDMAQREGGFEFEFHRLDLRYEHQFSADTRLKVAGALGVDSTHLNDGRVLDHVLSGRASLNHRFSDAVLFRGGVNVNSDSYDVSVNSTSIDSDKLWELFATRTDQVIGGFATLDVKPNAWIQVQPGVRVGNFRSGDENRFAVDPSILARFRVTNDVSLVHGFGIAHQTPNYIPNVPGARVAGLSGGLQRAIFASSGVEVALPWQVRGTANVFDNVIFDVTDPFSSTQDFAIDPEAAKERPTAHAYGLELALHRPLTRKFGGMLSYTLSRSTRTYDTYETVAGSDRTHVLNLAGLYTLGANWRVGARGLAYSGVPGRMEGARRIFDQERSAPFFRLDLRLERRFRLGPESYLSVVAEVQNATLSKEVLRRICSQQPTGVTCEDTTVGPIFLPNIKIEGRY